MPSPSTMSPPWPMSSTRPTNWPPRPSLPPRTASAPPWRRSTRPSPLHPPDARPTSSLSLAHERSVNRDPCCRSAGRRGPARVSFGSGAEPAIDREQEQEERSQAQEDRGNEPMAVRLQGAGVVDQDREGNRGRDQERRGPPIPAGAVAKADAERNRH